MLLSIVPNPFVAFFALSLRPNSRAAITHLCAAKMQQQRQRQQQIAQQPLDFEKEEVATGLFCSDFGNTEPPLSLVALSLIFWPLWLLCCSSRSRIAMMTHPTLKFRQRLGLSRWVGHNYIGHNYIGHNHTPNPKVSSTARSKPMGIARRRLI